MIVSFRKGSLSATLSIILGILVMISLISTMIYAYEASLEGIKNAAGQGESIVQEAMKYVHITASSINSSLVLQPTQGPVKVLAVIKVTERDNGVNLVPIKNDFELEKPLSIPCKPKDLMNEGSYILVLLENGNYVLFGPRTYDIGSASEENMSVILSSNTEGSVLDLLNLNPYILGGKVIEYDSFMTNPIPGSTSSEIGANYVPELYAVLNSKKNSIVGENLKLKFNPVNDTYTAYICNDATGLFIMVPILINRTDKLTGDLLFRFTASPINNVPLNSLDIFHVKLSYRSIEYAVLPEDFYRSPIIVAPGDVMYSGEIRYSVARALYVEAGSEFNVDLSSFSELRDPNTAVARVQSSDYVMIIHFDTAAIFRRLPRTVDRVVLVIGVQLAVKYYWEKGSGSPNNPYARVNIGVYEVRDAKVTVPKELVGVPVLIPLMIPNASIQVTNPSGGVVSLFSVSNVNCTYDGKHPYKLLAFIPSSAGTYTLRYAHSVLTYGSTSVNLNFAGVEPFVKVRKNVWWRKGPVIQSQVYSTVIVHGSIVSSSIISEGIVRDEFIGTSSCDLGEGCSEVYTVYGNVPPQARVSVEVDDGTGWCPAFNVSSTGVTGGYDGIVPIQEYGKCNGKARAYSQYSIGTEELKVASVYDGWGWTNIHTNLVITFRLKASLRVEREGAVALVYPTIEGSAPIYGMILTNDVGLLKPILKGVGP